MKCSPAKLAAAKRYYRDHREECCRKQRQYHDATGKSRVADRRRFLGLMKDGVGCRGCGTTSKLDFHHRDIATKEFNVSDRVMAPWSVLMTEIFKCDVLCRSCHNARRPLVI